MRKLLLATVALIGASTGAATIAEAQTASPTPGTVTVRLNGRFRFYGTIISDRDNNVGGNKQANYGFFNYARLFPGFDGVAANGLKYGSSLEIRQDAGRGAGGGTYGSISGTTVTRGQLYFRREWGYLGTDQLGTLRLGSTDSPSSLYMTGNFENFNDGGLNGDVQFQQPAATQATWPFADVGNFYATTKAVYLSPQLYGLDFGVSFEPNTGAVNGEASGACSTPNFQGSTFIGSGVGVASPGCDRLSSTSVNLESARRKNTVDALLRYRASFGGFGVAATGAYIVSSNVKDTAGVPFTNNPFAVGGARPNYDGLSIGDFGAAVTYGGFSVGGKYMFGRYNGQFGLDPKGAPNAEAFLVGASYTIGPVVVGAHYLNYQSAGDIANAIAGRQRKEQGLAAGATYSLAPGVSLFTDFLYNQRKQNGFDFTTNASVSAAAPNGVTTRNKVTSKIFAVGTSFSW